LKRLKQAINCNNADQAAKIIQEALGIESDEVANDLSLAWPARQRARIIGIVLRIEALFGPDNDQGHAILRVRNIVMVVGTLSVGLCWPTGELQLARAFLFRRLRCAACSESGRWRPMARNRPVR
jgi:hypothetical protein